MITIAMKTLVYSAERAMYCNVSSFYLLLTPRSALMDDSIEFTFNLQFNPSRQPTEWSIFFSFTPFALNRKEISATSIFEAIRFGKYVVTLFLDDSDFHGHIFAVIT